MYTEIVTVYISVIFCVSPKKVDCKQEMSVISTAI
jgi:hypothetical protein